MLSVIIPSRCDEYLQKTIDGLLEKAEGDIEIIVVLDGYWPKTPLNPDKRVIVVHHGTQFDNRGMRASINAGMALSKGKYVMKIDEHCLVDQGFDVKLAADCEDNWVVIPRRYRLDAEKWEIVKDGRSPVDYNYLAYPYERPHDQTCGLHGAEWRRRDRDNILVDDTVSMQGSAYFMTKKHWDTVIKSMDDESYGGFTHEAQEISNKTWWSGGRVVVNKKTFYAHMHKGKNGKKYGFSNAQYKRHGEEKEKGRLFCIAYWLYTKDYPLTFDDIYKKLGPWPGWSETWKEDLIRDKLIENSK
jgi:Glycosyltransferases involved in cell wall biogenesis